MLVKGGKQLTRNGVLTIATKKVYYFLGHIAFDCLLGRTLIEKINRCLDLAVTRNDFTLTEPDFRQPIRQPVICRHTSFKYAIVKR